MTVATDLRTAVRDEHDAIERTRFATGLADGSITVDEYADLLRQLHAVLSAVERAWRTRPELERIYSFVDHTRLAAIEGDLAAMGQPLDDGSEPQPACAKLIRSIEDWAATSPVSLVGPMYVLEGSRMGSQGMAQTLPSALGLEEGRGVDYHVSPEGWMDDWRSFKEGLEELCTDDPEAAAAVITAAKRTFVALTSVYDGRSVDR